MIISKYKKFKDYFFQVINDIRQHPVPFLISLLFSLMLFYYIANIGVQSLLMVADLQYRINSNDLFIINKKNIKIKITFRGKPDDLKLLNEDIIKAFINIDATKPGDYVYKVNVDQSYLPNNIKVIKIEPSSIKVTLDKNFRKRLKIEPKITGKCEKGFSVAQVTFTKTPYVIVEGPYSLLSKIDKVNTSEISVEGLNFPFVVPLKLENELLKVISPLDIQVVIDIRPTSIMKTIKDIPILLSNKSNKFSYILSVNKFEAILLLSEDFQNKISTSDLIFVIDCKYFTIPGVYTLKIMPKTDSSMEILSTDPEFVQLTINHIDNE